MTARMPARMLLVTLGVISIAACSGAQTGPSEPPPAGGQSPVAAPTEELPAGGAGTSLVEAAAAITDVCALMPMDLAATIVPDAFAPQGQLFPPYKCTVSNGTSVVEVTLGAYDTGAAAAGGVIPGAQPVAGLAAGGFLELPFPDDAYLTVLLSPEQGQLYVEVAGHDDKDHTDDAIAVAQRILEALQ